MVIFLCFDIFIYLSFAFIFKLYTCGLLKKKKAENSQIMATNICLFLN